MLLIRTPSSTTSQRWPEPIGAAVLQALGGRVTSYTESERAEHNEQMSTVFLDTNVLAYQFDARDEPKRARAAQVVRSSHTFVASTQVMLELFVVLTRRLTPPIPHAAANRVVRRVGELTIVPTHPELVLQAIDTSEQHQLSLWDAMIVEAAAAASCDELWSEDFSHGTTIRGVRIVNPFAS